MLGCDQTLSLGDRLFHKPRDMEDARRHLLALSGKTHQLNSAAVLARDGATLWRHVSVASLTMRELDPGFIGRHLSRVGEKALASVGAYQIVYDVTERRLAEELAAQNAYKQELLQEPSMEALEDSLLNKRFRAHYDQEDKQSGTGAGRQLEAVLRKELDAAIEIKTALEPHRKADVTDPPGFADDRPFSLIGLDNGLLDKPVSLKRLPVSPGERVEIVAFEGAFHGRSSAAIASSSPSLAAFLRRS